MNLLKETLGFFIYSNVFVSICVMALCQSTSLIMGASTSHILPFVFFSTLFGYNFQRLVRFNPCHTESAHLNWIVQHRKLMVFISVVAFILSIYFAFRLSVSAYYLLIPASAISLLYPIKIFSFNNKLVPLRELPSIKIFLIALVWSIVSVGVVLIENDTLFTIDGLLLFSSRFFFILAITIPFDIRDLKFDSSRMRTIPQVLGEQKAKWFALICLAIFEIISIVHYLFGEFSIDILIALLLTSLISGLLIIKSNKNKHNYYFSFLIESTSILMYFLLFIIPLAFGIFAP